MLYPYVYPHMKPRVPVESQRGKGVPVNIYQVLGMASSATSVILLLVFFVSISSFDHTFISDNLERYIGFRVAITICICVQSVLYMLYFGRFCDIRRDVVWVGWVSILISLIGWFVLITNYQPPTHLIGFGIYVAFFLLYWCVILYFDRLIMPQTNRDMAFFALAFVLGWSYILFYILDNGKSWFYEYLGMIAAFIATFIFFASHNPDPYDIVHFSPVDVTDQTVVHAATSTDPPIVSIKMPMAYHMNHVGVG